jgi:16S rRNA U516 pseudouridylate synthase RsuA-like enzyme
MNLKSERYNFYTFNKPEEADLRLPFEDRNSITGYFADLDKIYAIGAVRAGQRGLVLITDDRNIGPKVMKSDYDIELTIQTKAVVNREVLKELKIMEGTFAGRMKSPREIVIRIRNSKLDEVLGLLANHNVQIHAMTFTAVAGIRLNMLGLGNSRMMTKKERTEFSKII